MGRKIVAGGAEPAPAEPVGDRGGQAPGLAGHVSLRDVPAEPAPREREIYPCEGREEGTVEEW